MVNTEKECDETAHVYRAGEKVSDEIDGIAGIALAQVPCPCSAYHTQHYMPYAKPFDNRLGKGRCAVPFGQEEY